MTAAPDIEQFVRSLNQAWQDDDMDTLRACFHDQVQLFVAGAQPSCAGADQMVDTYRDFLSIGTIHGFSIDDLDIRQFAGHAICHMRFSIDFEIDGQRQQEHGTEIYVIDTAGDPQVTWRGQFVGGG